MRLGKYEKDLPIKVSLIAFGNFHKSISIKPGELPEVICIPVFCRTPEVVSAAPSEITTTASIAKWVFRYERHEQVCQVKGQHHIVAVYRQVES